MSTSRPTYATTPRWRSARPRAAAGRTSSTRVIGPASTSGWPRPNDDFSRSSAEGRLGWTPSSRPCARSPGPSSWAPTPPTTRTEGAVLNADPTRQLALLELQAIDTRLDQIAHATSNLPQHREVSGLEDEARTLDTQLVNSRTALSDV